MIVNLKFNMQDESDRDEYEIYKKAIDMHCALFSIAEKIRQAQDFGRDVVSIDCLDFILSKYEVYL